MMETHILQTEGSSVQLRCHATGSPTPDISWYKDGILLEWLETSLSSGDEGLWMLRLSNLKMADAGRYMCRVVNEVGELNFTYTIEVLGEILLNK